MMPRKNPVYHPGRRPLHLACVAPRLRYAAPRHEPRLLQTQIPAVKMSLTNGMTL